MNELDSLQPIEPQEPACPDPFDCNQDPQAGSPDPDDRNSEAGRILIRDRPIEPWRWRVR
jgi:hypothetical protein